MTYTLLFIGGFGPLELGLILMLAVLLFGASKLPELARASGEAMGEFQKGREEVEQDLREMRDTAKQATDLESETDEQAA